MSKFLPIVMVGLLLPALCIGTALAGEQVVLKDASGRPLTQAETAQFVASTSCGSCHEAVHFADSVHYNRPSPSGDPESADCLSCHLSGREAASEGSRGAARLMSTPRDAACLSCHQDVWDERPTQKGYAHSKLTCVDCHKGAGHDSTGVATCRGCHNAEGTHVLPSHRGLTISHLKNIRCEDCHSAPVKNSSQPRHPHTVLTSSEALGARGCVECHATGRMSRAGAVREGVLKPGAPWAAAALLIMCTIHYTIYGRRGEKRIRGEATIERFSPAERLIHGATAFSFAFLAVTGVVFLLRLDSPDGPWRNLHGQAGVVFTISLAALVAVWVSQARFESWDAEWFRRLGGYFRMRGPCPAGRFNAGQKLFFWLVAAAAGAMVCLTGLVLAAGRGSASALAFTLHDLAAVCMMLGITGHVYMSLVINTESARAIVTGRVSLRWARRHHGQWVVNHPSQRKAGEHKDGTLM